MYCMQKICWTKNEHTSFAHINTKVTFINPWRDRRRGCILWQQQRTLQKRDREAETERERETEREKQRSL